VIGNPFEDRLTDFYQHGLRRKKCPVFDMDKGFFTFDGVPVIPDISLVGGQVLVVLGQQGCGKSVFGHRCIHEYSSGRVAVDLMNHHDVNMVDKEAPEKIVSLIIGGLRNTERTKELVRGENETYLLDSGNQWTNRHQLLGNLLEQEKISLVVRLPRLDGTVEAKAIIDDIRRWSDAAFYANESIYIYEGAYAADDDLKKLKRPLADNRGARVCEVGSLTVGDVERFISYRLGLLDFADTPAETKRLANVFSIFSDEHSVIGYGLTFPIINELLYDTFQDAIENGKENITDRKLLAAARPILVDHLKGDR
jgi:hypothetical protein